MGRVDVARFYGGGARPSPLGFIEVEEGDSGAEAERVRRSETGA